MTDSSDSQVIADRISDSPLERPVSAPIVPALAPTQSSAYWRILVVLFLLYLFLVSIKAMSGGLKYYAEDPDNQARIHSLFEGAGNPFIALLAGILMTSLVQSSSFTTSFIIALVAAGQLGAEQAVPAIMGANIGTSVTNTLVSLTHWRNRREFQTAFAAATVHDIFNFLTVLLLLPLEVYFGVLSKFARLAAGAFNLPEDITVGKGVVSAVTKPVIDKFTYFLSDICNLDRSTVGIVLAIAGMVLLFASLVFLVRMLKGLMLGRLETLFRRFFFSTAPIALVVGIVVTILVQSSSVTTSLVIPFVGAGLLTLRQVFPFMVGANIGTTCTGLLAAAAAPTSGSLMVAFVHLLFNVIGAAVFIPLRQIPIAIAHRLARFVARNRYFALLYIAVIFVLAPILCIYVSSLCAPG